MVLLLAIAVSSGGRCDPYDGADLTMFVAYSLLIRISLMEIVKIPYLANITSFALLANSDNHPQKLLNR
jgi:hypothetical protein